MLKTKKITIIGIILVMLLSVSTIGVVAYRSGDFRRNNKYNYYKSEDSPYNYGEALQKAIYFYMQQRSGELPKNNPVIWRGDSGLNDGADVGLDLTGGYYDAGDHVKFALPMASTAATIAWSIYEFEDAFEEMNQLDEALDAIKWATDYLINCHTGPNEFYFQVGDGHEDHSWWGPVEVLEEFMERPSFKADMTNMATTPVAATAAALAFAAIIFEEDQPEYAMECLEHAQQLYEFGYATQDDEYYHEIAGDFYFSWNGFWDELAAAGALLYLNTDDETYLDEAELALANSVERPEMVHDWTNMMHMTQILLAQITEKEIYIDAIESTLDYWLPGGGISYTPGGLAWAGPWGSLRYSANAALLASIWATDELCTSSKSSSYKNLIGSQINYILGDNPRGGSYMIGFGENYPQNPHHRTAHGSWGNNINIPEKTRHILYGALVGGPGVDDDWEDLRGDYQKNEVACDYNSGLIGALAYLTTEYDGMPLKKFPRKYFTPKEERFPEFFTAAKVSGPKIPRGEILHNGDFSDGLAWWSTSGTYGTSDATFTVIGNELAVEITDAGTEGWHVQLVQGGLTIEQAGEYIINFSARAAAPRDIEASIGEEGGSYTFYGGTTFSLSTETNRFTHTFTMGHNTDENARLQFNMGIDDTDIYLSDISVVESKVVDIEQPPTLRIPVLNELLTNGDFSDGLDPWYNSLGWSSAVFTTSIIDGEVAVEITDAGTEGWHVLIRQGGLTLVPGAEYTLSFDARAVTDRIIEPQIQIGGFWVAGTSFTLTTEMTRYSWTFSVSAENNNNVDVQFAMGMDNTDLYLDNVKLGRTILIDNPDYVEPVNLDLESEISIKMVSHVAWPARISENLSYRYYLNLTEVYKAGYSADNISIQLMYADVPVEVSELIYYGGLTFYIKVDYSGNKIYPGSISTSEVETVIRIGLPTDKDISTEAWDETNDWSFQGLSVESIQAENIVVYEGWKRVYGKKPPRCFISLDLIHKLLDKYPEKRAEIIDWIIKIEQILSSWKKRYH